MTFDMPQNRIVADGHRQPCQQLFACSAASGVAEQPHEVRSALRFSCKRSRRRPFDKSFARISGSNIATAPGATREQQERLESGGLAGAGRASYDAMLMLLYNRGMTVSRLRAPIRATGSVAIQRYAAQRPNSISSSCAIETLQALPWQGIACKVTQTLFECILTASNKVTNR
jgi:hypothetical protein